MTSRELLTGLALLTLGLFAWWVNALRDEDAEVAQAGAPKPDYIAEGVVAVTMNEAGRAARRLTTPRLWHYPDDDSTELEEPRLTILSPSAPPWRIRSDTGWIGDDGEELLLQGTVRAQRAASRDLEALSLETSEMLLLPDWDYAETDRFAELERGAGWVTATDGMQVWFGPQLRIRSFGRTRAKLMQLSGGGPRMREDGDPMPPTE